MNIESQLARIRSIWDNICSSHMECTWKIFDRSRTAFIALINTLLCLNVTTQMLFGFKPLFPWTTWVIKHTVWSGLHCCVIHSPSNTFPDQIQDCCGWNGHSASGRFILHPNETQLETSSSASNSKPLSLLLSSPFPSLPEWVKYSTNSLYPYFHILFKEPPPLRSALMTLNLFACVSSCLQFFYISFSLNLCLLSLFKLFHLLPYQ